MSYEAMERDQAQEVRQAARVMTQNAEIMWQTLEDSILPESVVDECFIIWWKYMLSPKLELPDFSKLFDTSG